MLHKLSYLYIRYQVYIRMPSCCSCTYIHVVNAGFVNTRRVYPYGSVEQVLQLLT